MASYHDLEKATYDAVVAETITRMHGQPDWTAKELMKRELVQIGAKHKVSYDWSQGRGLIPLIIGGARYALD